MTDAIHSVGLIIIGAVVGWFLKVVADRMSHKRLFDHRLRLEKEYGLYSELWGVLFELRGTVGGHLAQIKTSYVSHNNQALKLFDTFHEAIQKGMPFMSVSVYTHSGEILKIVHSIVENEKKIELLKTRRVGLEFEADRKIADEQLQLSEEIDSSFEEFIRLYHEIAQAIRNRVTP